MVSAGDATDGSATGRKANAITNGQLFRFENFVFIFRRGSEFLGSQKSVRWSHDPLALTRKISHDPVAHSRGGWWPTSMVAATRSTACVLVQAVRKIVFKRPVQG